MEARIRPNLQMLDEIAREQGGFFTTRQAHACGVSAALCNYHVQKGRFRRVRRGLYQQSNLEGDPAVGAVYGGWLAAALPSALVSHQSALLLHALTECAPAKVHLTIPRNLRKKAPPGVVLHTATRPPSTDEIVTVRGLPVTSPNRTIIDCAAAGLDQALLEGAVEVALSDLSTTRTQLLFMAQDRAGNVRGLIREVVETVSRRSSRPLGFSPKG